MNTTGTAGTSTANRPRPQPSQQHPKSSQSPKPSGNNPIHTISVGTIVHLTTREGDVFEGTFESRVSANNIHGIAIKLVKLVTSRRQEKLKVTVGALLKFKNNEIAALTTVDGKDLLDMLAKSNGVKEGFVTDTEISKPKASGQGGRPRELSKWESPSGPSSPSIDLEEATSGKLGTQWDQFEVNRQLFGVTTSFDESIYTTPLDRTAKDFHHREKEAHRIAEEIMGDTKALGNVHMAEERGLKVDDSGMDEEDRYGAVVRDEAGERADKLGSTVPASARARNSAPRKSITNVNADEQSLQAALQAVQKSSETVHRRLSQINEADLANLLTDDQRPADALSASIKSKALNPNASEFVPSAEVARPAPSYYNHQYYHQPQGYYGGGYGYYDPYQTAAYYDPSYYYAAAGYYAQQPQCPQQSVQHQGHHGSEPQGQNQQQQPPAQQNPNPP